MSTYTKQTALREKLVFDYFCPEETRACSPVLDKRIYDLCFAANITTVGQLVDMTDEQLRSKSFSNELIDRISQVRVAAQKTQNVVPSFSSGAQGRVAAISCLPLAGGYGTNGIKYGA